MSSETLKIKLSSNPLLKLIGILLTLFISLMIINECSLDTKIPEKIGYILIYLFMIFLSLGIYRLGDDRYLFFPTQTKTITLHRFLRRRKEFTLRDLTEISIHRNHITLHIADHDYKIKKTLPYQESLLSYLEENTSLYHKQTMDYFYVRASRASYTLFFCFFAFFFFCGVCILVSDTTNPTGPLLIIALSLLFLLLGIVFWITELEFIRNDGYCRFWFKKRLIHINDIAYCNVSPNLGLSLYDRNDKILIQLKLNRSTLDSVLTYLTQHEIRLNNIPAQKVFVSPHLRSADATQPDKYIDEIPPKNLNKHYKLFFVDLVFSLFTIGIILYGIVTLSGSSNYLYVLRYIGLFVGLYGLKGILNCYYINKLYQTTLKNGTKLTGSISRFSNRNGKSVYPWFTFQTEEGMHEVIGFKAMRLSSHEESEYLNHNYTIWYAPMDNNAVIYGSGQPEPSTSRSILFSAGIKMVFAIGLLIFSFVGSPLTDPTGEELKINWANSYQKSPFTQEDLNSDTIQWFCASYAIYTNMNLKKDDTIGGVTLDDTDSIQKVKASLKDGWGITDRKTAIQSINWILEGGHRLNYRKTVKELKKKGWLSLSQKEYQKKVKSFKQDYRYLAIYKSYHAYQDYGIDGWDYSRAMQILGDCYVSGYINLKECLDQSLTIAKQLQSEFKSWKEVGQSYLYGYQYWKKTETEEIKADYTYREEVYKLLLALPHGPYQIPFKTKLTATWYKK
ncbi:putative tRNA ligase [Lachnospiraceae bacterium KM106-2]|nr:putative tRNA ligase [Lachnospiraceae bacterium KM106-2]